VLISTGDQSKRFLRRRRDIDIFGWHWGSPAQRNQSHEKSTALKHGAKRAVEIYNQDRSRQEVTVVGDATIEPVGKTAWDTFREEAGGKDTVDSTSHTLAKKAFEGT
jgi:hypothetical protein